MQPSQRLDQRLHMTREELQTMSEEEERGEQVCRAKLLRCQRQLKAKEEELSRQSQYFQNFKIQLQRKLSVSRDREQSLLSRIYALEKQLLDMTVSAATGMATMKAARITAGIVTYLEEQERGEGEGEEEAKEDRKRQQRPSVGNESDAEGSRNMDITNGTRLQSFIISLQEDLRVLLEREEQWMTEQRSLTEQLQEAQERSSFLGCRAEEMKAEVQQLKLSESCWMEEVEDLREENQQLQQLLRESSSTVISMESSSARSSGKVSSGEKVVPVGRHQAAVESTESTSGPTKTSLAFTTEIVDEFKLGNMSLEESPSEESDALLHAYKSLGLGDDVRALQEQHRDVKVSLEDNSSHKTHDSHVLHASFCQDDPSSTQDDLVYALNQENRALANRIQELLYHMELREEEIPKEKTCLREEIKRLQENEVRLEQTNQEQAGLISELTKKTEDDLNAIMELQQKLAEIKDLQYLQDCKGPGSASDSLHSGQCFKSLDGNSPFNQETFDSIQSLKTQQEELSASIKSFKEQQRDVSQSVRAQNEEKQQLTRDIWGLKEEKDRISRSVAELKLEKEKLNRTVCGLRDERKQFTKSMSRLKEEEEHMKNTLSALERDKEAMKKCLSTETEKRDQIIQSMQSLQTESEKLNRSVFHLKEKRDKLCKDLKCEKEQRDQEIGCDSLKEDQLVSRWREGKEKQEVLIIQGLKKQKESLQSVALQIQSEESSSEKTERSESPAGPTEEQSDVRRTIEALKEALKKLQEEIDQSHLEAKQLQSELLESEGRREEAERRAAHAAEKVTRLTMDKCLMEDVKRENNSLSEQVMELQSTVSALIKQKCEALSLKDQIEEQHRVLSAQLKAKTEALQELNAEYMALKRRRVGESVEEEVLVSLRTRYNDIRSKYDALLKRKSQTDFEAAPLKAKLSCLVLKCRERNELLAQMMKVMHRRGCVDSQLSQQVEHLLSDAALQDYTTAFTPGNHTKTQHNHTGYATQLLATLQGCTLVSTSLHEQDKGKVLADPAESCFTSEKCSHHLHVVAPEASPLNEKSAVPSMQEPDTVQLTSRSTNEHLTTNTAQLSLSRSQSPRNGFHHTQDKCHPVSAWNPASPSSSTRVSNRRGLSSPEKILSLHEQLQQTVMSSYQLSETEGKDESTRRTRSVSASAELDHANEQNHSLNSTTLFNAVASRSATLTTSRFINHNTSTTTSPSELTFPSSSGPKHTDVITPVPELSDAKQPETLENTITDVKDGISEATTSESAALDANPLKDRDVCVSNSLVRSSKHTQCIHGSLKRSNKPSRKFSDALDMRKSARPKSAEVSCVEVINTVGQSSVLIGWERPPLDELGCSNGTFVYGYRVFVDGNFHKSVLSSACTKCVLENVDLSLPVQISVQTLGLNGRTSNSVHTMYTQH
ncbi:trichohyalin-like isoform X2 [Gouania willdenowi]|uniref:trichohyalin-like isoform X2 n=1 Tax=Gouania willdenowi TaxID=441366 RepID=UPI0010562A38|nr:trichohyalin-like isoform X2 [Gouania willdenowi]